MKHTYFLVITAMFALSACGGQSVKPQSASTKPATKPATKAAAAVTKPVAKSKSSLPAPGTGKAAATITRPVMPAPKGPSPKVPGTISFERRISGGVAGDMLGRNEKSLRAQFGEPRLNIVEGDGRKMQYVTAKCVVDIYLFPPAAGKEAAVVHIDARDDAGRDMDRDSCVLQLTRK